MLNGEFRYNLDAKNRIFVPAKMREKLGNDLVVAKDLREKCLKIYSKQEWEEYIELIKKQKKKLSDVIARVLCSSAGDVTPDGQGRILLPPSLVAHAELEKDVVIIGCGTYAEIWSADKYEKFNADIDYGALVDALDEYI